MDPDTLAIFSGRLGYRIGTLNPRWVNAFVAEWARHENTDALNNPLATTLDWDGATNFNSVGVKNYPSLDDGIDATQETLMPVAPGSIRYYPDLVQALLSGRIDEEARGRIASQIGTWGTHSFADQVRNGWTPDPAPLPQDPVLRLNTAILERLEIIRQAAETFANALQLAADPHLFEQ